MQIVFQSFETAEGRDVGGVAFARYKTEIILKEDRYRAAGEILRAIVCRGSRGRKVLSSLKAREGVPAIPVTEAAVFLQRYQAAAPVRNVGGYTFASQRSRKKAFTVSFTGSSRFTR